MFYIFTWLYRYHSTYPLAKTQLIVEDGPCGLQTCVGVEFLKNGTTYKTLPPKKDVIISAGAPLYRRFMKAVGVT